jgi:hypothetical protein
LVLAIVIFRKKTLLCEPLRKEEMTQATKAILGKAVLRITSIQVWVKTWG